jgi:hypothetical protein
MPGRIRTRRTPHGDDVPLVDDGSGVAGVGHVIAEAGEELAEPEKVSVDVDVDLSRAQVHPAARWDSS